MKKISVGRSPDNNVVLQDNTVSGHHAFITVSGQNIYIEDNNSRNGVIVNGSKVKNSIIQFGDDIKLGDCSLNLMMISHLLKDENIVASPSNGDFTKTSYQESGKKQIKIGRAIDNDIIINDPYISGHHAVMMIDDSGNMVIQDLNSANGTFVNRQRISIQNVSMGDSVQLGTYKLSLDRFSPYTTGGFAGVPVTDNVEVKLKEGVNRVGRAPDNDIIVAHPTVSAHHALIIKQGEFFEIEDLRSTNGTFVNGARITKARITKNDKVTLGLYLPLNITSTNIIKSYKGEVKLDLINIGFGVKVKEGWKQILSDISLTIFPSEFVGLIGPSGSGKTTLMNIINGYVSPTEGEVLVNSNSLHANYDLFRGNIGFVPQDDIIHRELTVYQSLFYSAKLRLPGDTSREEIDGIVCQIMEKLGIMQTRDTIIGSPEKKGISGGQRKRVNLAQELITQPSLLLLDEPTSGLDPKTDHDIMQLLRKLADEGRIILLTTHHITQTNFKIFDDILLLAAGGKLAFFGPSYPDSLEYYNVEQPHNIFTKLEETGDAEQNNSKYKRSNYYNEYVEKRKTDTSKLDLSTQTAGPKTRRNFNFTQFFVLLARYFTIKKFDIPNLAIMLLQAPVIGLLVGLTLRNLKVPGMPTFVNPLFITIVCAIFFGVLNTSREIVSERAIYFRERMVMLKIPSYLSSKFSLLTFISIIQSISLVIIIHPLCGLKIDIIKFAVIIILISLTSMSLGLLLSTMVKSPESAISISIFALIPQMIFGGTLYPIGRMPDKPIVNYISYLMISRWSFESLGRMETKVSPETFNIIDTTTGAIKSITCYDQMVDQMKFLPQNDFTNTSLLIIAIHGLVYLTIVAILLKLRDKV